MQREHGSIGMTDVSTRTAAPRQGLPEDAIAAFRNRLAKGARHWGKWALRRGFGAYRVYDRDLPEFPLAIDCYVPEDSVLAPRVHLQEIDTGWEQTEREHAAWVAQARAAAAAALGMPPATIAFKERRKRHGREQHTKTGAAGSDFAIVEGGLRFIVNLEAYLDTGLFLDHQALRAMVRKRATGRRMLDVFAYTGSFTVYAAAGGATATDTVDLSNTYLDWAARNFAANGMDPRTNTLIRADAGLARRRARRGEALRPDRARSTGILELEGDGQRTRHPA